MKKSKILVVALIGLLMAGGLVVVGCDLGDCTYGACKVELLGQGTAPSHPNAYVYNTEAGYCLMDICNVTQLRNGTKTQKGTAGYTWTVSCDGCRIKEE